MHCVNSNCTCTYEYTIGNVHAQGYYQDQTQMLLVYKAVSYLHSIYLLAIATGCDKIMIIYRKSDVY